MEEAVAVATVGVTVVIPVVVTGVIVPPFVAMVMAGMVVVRGVARMAAVTVLGVRIACHQEPL